MPKYSRTGVYAYVSTPQNTTTTVAGTYYRLAGTFTNEILEGFFIDVDTLTYQGQKGCFEIQVSASFITDTNNTEITLALFKNGVLQANSIMTGEIDATTDKMPLSLVDVIELEEDDTIEIKVASDKAGAVIQAITLNTSAHTFH